jgi:hypothetical protein
MPREVNNPQSNPPQTGRGKEKTHVRRKEVKKQREEETKKQSLRTIFSAL